MTPAWRVILLMLAGALAACGEEEAAAPPPPAEMSAEAVGYYCGMLVAEHAGPKAQIRLVEDGDPIWFSSVRDGLAFTMLPGEPDWRAFYVTDMTGAEDWGAALPGPWIAAPEAVYVIGSRRRGGMGQMEAVPFSDPEAARAFAARHGGQVVAFADIPRDYVLGGGDQAEIPPAPAGAAAPDHAHPPEGP